jgi:hypothetical protein
MAIAYPAPSTSTTTTRAPASLGSGLGAGLGSQPLPGSIVEVTYRDGQRLVRRQHDPALNDLFYPGSRSLGCVGRK